MVVRLGKETLQQQYCSSPGCRRAVRAVCSSAERRSQRIGIRVRVRVRVRAWESQAGTRPLALSPSRPRPRPLALDCLGDDFSTRTAAYADGDSCHSIRSLAAFGPRFSHIRHPSRSLAS